MGSSCSPRRLLEKSRGIFFVLCMCGATLGVFGMWLLEYWRKMGLLLQSCGLLRCIEIPTWSVHVADINSEWMPVSSQRCMHSEHWSTWTGQHEPMLRTGYARVGVIISTHCGHLKAVAAVALGCTESSALGLPTVPSLDSPPGQSCHLTVTVTTSPRCYRFQCFVVDSDALPRTTSGWMRWEPNGITPGHIA